MSEAVRAMSDRMSDLESMYDDMQDRVFEIDKNRKNNLVFYGVKPHAIAGYQARLGLDPDDQDECEAIIKHLFSTQMQVNHCNTMCKPHADE